MLMSVVRLSSIIEIHRYLLAIETLLARCKHVCIHCASILDSGDSDGSSHHWDALTFSNRGVVLSYANVEIYLRVAAGGRNIDSGLFRFACQ